MCCIHSFEVFGQVFILTGGGPSDATTTIAHQVYRNGFEYYRMGYASAEAVVLLVIILTITVINYRYGGNGND
jgi:multiple sugar transport system permease protein/raffinose/stachyose/melibiose transport system permease protein